MALYKEIVKDNGIIATYHKIKNVSIMMRSPHVDEETNEIKENTHLLSVKVRSYVSEEYRRNSEDNAVSNRDYHFRITLEEIAETPVLALAYNKLKKLSVYADAIDC